MGGIVIRLGVMWALIFALGAAPLVAQTPRLPAGGTVGAGDAPAAVTLPDPLTPESINALVSRLSDGQVRALLLDRLDALATQPTVPMGGYESLGALLAEMMRRIGKTATYSVTHIPEFLSAEAAVLGRFAERLGDGGLRRLLIAAAFAIAAGMAAQYALHPIWRRRLRAATVAPIDLAGALHRSGLRLFYHLIGAAVFAVSAIAVLTLLKPDETAPVASQIMLWLVFMPQVIVALLRFFLAPWWRDGRLLSVDDRTAKILFWNFTGITYALGATFAMLALHRVFGGVTGFWFWFNVMFFGWMAVLFWVTRDGWRSIMAGRRTHLTAFDAWSIRAYPYLAVVSILAVWLFCLGASVMNAGRFLSGGRHFISLAIVLVAPLLDTLIHAVVRHLMPPMEGQGQVAQDAYDAGNRAYVRIGRVLVFGAVLLATAQMWHVSPMAMASAGIGDRLASAGVKVGMIAVIGYLTWEIVRLAINIRLAREQTADAVADAPSFDGEGMGGKPTTRLGTILPPVSVALQGMILSVTVLMMLANLGIDVTALLAGAGIVGIAVGFGSQKLVADVISGMFFLIDDAFRMNEYVDAGGSVGTVDRISLRSLRLRDAKGPVLIVPYSEIKTVTNFGRDWGIMKLRFTVPFDTDVEKVRKIFKRIGQELLADPELGPGFIEPFKSQGVYEYNDHGIVLRGKFTHKPGAQFMIRKKVYTRIKEEFEKAGIEFARREVKVDFGGTDHSRLTKDQELVVKAAAAEHVNEVDRQAAAGAVAMADGASQRTDSR